MDMRSSNRTNPQFRAGSYRSGRISSIAPTRTDSLPPYPSSAVDPKNPKRILKHLESGTWPDGPPCNSCSSLISLFTATGKPRRHARFDSKNALEHLESFSVLAESSRSCGLCALILSCCNKSLSWASYDRIIETHRSLACTGNIADAEIDEREGEEEPLRVILEECYGSGKLISELRVTIQSRFGNAWPRYIADDVLRVYSDKASAKVQGRPVSERGSDPGTLKLAQEWVEDCVHNHPECNWVQHHPTHGSSVHYSSVSNMVKGKAKLLAGVPIEPLLPARVIDIGTSDHQQPRLLISTGKRAKWAALSHRWPEDGQQIFTLVSENIKELERMIPRENLAATFQDALKLTRTLGLRYLWIDSLCIIQNSPEDWNEQSSQMPIIYKNAYVTIAAAATSDCLGGFLGERDWVPASRPFELTDRPAYEWSEYSNPYQASVYFEFPIDRNHKRDATTKTDNVNYLAYRAWCFQESTLSHRLLTFNRLQMSFTCLRHGLCESRETVPAVAREYRNAFPASFQGEVSNDFGKLQTALKSWYAVLTDYTNRDLTFPSDKLVAISGIAKVVGAFLKDKYFAGLWGKSLPHSLLWSPYDEEDFLEPGQVLAYPATPSLEYRAPSWSWASVDGRISSFFCRVIPSEPVAANVVDIETETTGPDEYGQVTSGSLIIEGPFKVAFRGHVLPSWPYQPQLCWNANCQTGGDDISHCIFDTFTPPLGSQLYCLQITRKYGLLLASRQNSNPNIPYQANEFVRIGVFHLRLKDVDNVKTPNVFSDNDIKTVHIF
ncbi:hypothetical protein HYALB_00007732 [Hymenoscyphus albidus]|uniref:Heterokaryon incompatibility domain-containing protein n=1 Tax=Hymenoscyphus albidus TaxID=595503 RepID=A0A9N9LHG2_9HELO|nr:hypothetical protein HYALB_00007732 [Hymenoscyphus albidus]